MKFIFKSFLLDLFLVFVANSTQLICSNNIRWTQQVCPADDLFYSEEIPVTVESNDVTSNSSSKTANFSSPVNLTQIISSNLSQKIGNDLRTGDDEPQIASFDEWTKQKLEEHQTKVADNQKNGVTSSGGNVVPQMAARNYASKECGAKVLHANPECQNAAAVLNEKERDEYMLNPCQTEGQKWFVVELCETVQITKIEIANFELFSSRPKDFKVWSSERYPSPEWTLVGEWTAEDKRELQGYEVKNRLYAKYLKVELLSHYGSEHFCPLSLVRVLGISMVEEYENEAMTQDQQTKMTNAQTSKENKSVSPATDSFNPDAHVPSEQTHKNDYLENAKKAVVFIAKEMYGKAQSVFLGASTPSHHLDQIPSSQTANKSICLNSSKDFLSSPVIISWTDCNICRVNTSYAVVEKFCGYYLLLTTLHHVTTSSSETGSGERDLEEKMNKFEDYDEEFLPIPIDFVEETNVDNESVESAFHSEHEANVIPSNENADGETNENAIDQTKHETSTTEFVDQNDNKTTLNQDRGTPTPPTNLASLPGVATSTKESVFLRLNNRIKTLELNISLSSQYLSELSKKYRKQMEDIQRAFNRTSRLFNETDAKFEESLEKQAKDLSTLKEEVSEMKPLMATLAKDYVVLQKEAVQWIAAFVFVEVFAVVIFLWCCFGGRTKRTDAVVDRHELDVLIEQAVARRLEILLQQNNNFNYKIDEYLKQDSYETGSSQVDLLVDAHSPNAIKKKKCKKKQKQSLNGGQQQNFVSSQTSSSSTIRKSSDQTFRHGASLSVDSPTTAPIECSSSAGILFSTSSGNKENSDRNWKKVHQKTKSNSKNSLLERKRSSTSMDQDRSDLSSTTMCFMNNLFRLSNPFDVLKSPGDRKRLSTDATRGFS